MSDDSKELSRMEDILSGEDYLPKKPMSRIEELLLDGAMVPKVDDTDNGKVLKVIDGEWKPGEDVSGDNLPPVSSLDNGKVLKVVNGEWNIGSDKSDIVMVQMGVSYASFKDSNQVTLPANIKSVLLANYYSNPPVPTYLITTDSVIFQPIEVNKSSGTTPLVQIRWGRFHSEFDSVTHESNVYNDSIIYNTQDNDTIARFTKSAALQTIPPVDSNDEGKVMQVGNDGTWQANDLPTYDDVPQVEAADVGKVLKATAVGEYDWGDAPDPLPAVTSTDNGKVLKVIEGGWDKGDIPDPSLEGTASGSIASFTDGSTLPMKKLEVDIEPVQSGSGEPSPTNVRSISGWDECNVGVSPNRLVGANWKDGYFINASGQEQSNNLYKYTTTMISVKPSTTYYVQMNYQSTAELAISVPYYNKNGDFISRDVVTTFNTRGIHGGQFTIPNNCYGIRVSLPLNSDEWNLQEGASIVADNTYTIDLDGTRYGGKLDVVSGVLTVDRGYVDLGSLNWGASSTGSRFYATVPSPYYKMTTDANSICSQYIDDGVGSSARGYYGNNGTVRHNYAANPSPSAYEIYIHDDRFGTDANEFKQAMNGVQLVYELATPQTIQLTPTEVKSLLATNNIFADTGDILDAIYYRQNAEEVADIVEITSPKELPTVSTSDEGKALVVNSEGEWDKGDIPRTNSVQVPPVIYDNSKLMKIADMTGFPELEKVFVTSEEYAQLTTAQKQDLSKIYYVSPYKFYTFKDGEITIRVNGTTYEWFFNGFTLTDNFYIIPSEYRQYTKNDPYEGSTAWSDNTSSTSLGIIEMGPSGYTERISAQDGNWAGNYILNTPIYGKVIIGNGDSQGNSYSDPYDVETPILIYYGEKQYTEYTTPSVYREITQAEYDLLPASKNSDGIIYFITDNS